MNKNFFSKENIQSAIWALFIGLMGFLGGLIWKHYSGPDRVIVERDETKNGSDTTVTIVKFEGDSATLEAFKSYNTNLSVKSKPQDNSLNIASILRPSIELPAIVEGYTDTQINTYASANIPRNTFSRNELIEIELKILNESTLKKISPAFIELVKKTGKNSVTLIWEEQFKINHLNNTIQFSSDFEKDEYILSIGFYLMDELHQKYPPRYSKKFKINII